MMRIVSTAAALSLLAAPAFANEMKLDLTGKSPAVAYAKIVRAARNVCAVPGADIYYNLAGDSCVIDTVQATIAKLANPKLNSYVAARKQFLTVAKL